MIIRKEHIVILLYALIPNAYTQSKDKLEGSGAQGFFIENKGQIIDLKSKPNSAVLYLLNTAGFNVQLRKHGFSYDLYENVLNDKNSIDQFHQSLPSITTYYHRIDITFIGSNPSCQIIPSEMQPGYFNYYKSSMHEQGIVNVRQYSKITYNEIYPGIDLVLYIDKNKGYKYNFVIHPSARLEDIKFKIEGPTFISCTGKALRFATRIGDVEELIPQSYYLQNDINDTIDVTFRKSDDNTYGFSLNSHIPSNITMVVDPTPKRLWGTYYGGNYYDRGSECFVDESGNSYLTGYTLSNNNIASAGSYQDSIAGSADGFLAKFNPQGNRVWGTYFGGTDNDQVWAGIIDKSGISYLAGFTKSTSGIATSGTHQNTLGGGFDGFLVKFSQDGYRIWGTYYGGNKDDKIYGIDIDSNYLIYLTGVSFSDTGIATIGSYQQFLFNTSSDAFLAKFDSNGNRIWGTYFGGESNDEPHTCSLDRLGNIYISGVTSSQQNIASPGSFQETYGGGNSDAFLAKFNTSGARIWSTYYGGSQDEQIFECVCDSSYDVYFTGETSSTNGITSPGCFQPNIGGSSDAMIGKFDSSGQRIWGTYYGGSGGEAGRTSVVGSGSVIFISGWTGSQNNISTPGAFKTTLSGPADGFITKFSGNGQRIWGSYYGGSWSTTILSSSYVKEDTLYLAGATQSQDSISTQGSWQLVYGGSQDAFLVKFLDCWHIDAAGPIAGPLNVCKPSNGVVYSIPPLAHAANYSWTIPPGFTITAGAGSSGITVDVTNGAASGLITVKGFNKCGDPGDSASLFVSVGVAPMPVISGPNSTCAGTGKVYTTDPGKSNYQWSVSAGGVITAGGTATDNTVTVTWNLPGTEHVYLNYTDAGCAAPNPTDYTVIVSPSPVVNVTITPTANSVCAGMSVTFSAAPTNGGGNPLYQWKVNGINSGINSNTYSYTPLNNDQVYCIMTSSVTGCIMNNPDTSNIIMMIVNQNLPVGITITALPTPPVCSGATVTYTAHPVNEGNTPTYQWKVNGFPVGTNLTTYSYIPVDGDLVTCTLNSSETCTTNNPALSNQLLMVIDSALVVGVTISPSSNPFCAGSPVTFTATPSNGGVTPSYQWKVNGINAGPNSNVYSFVPNNGDQVSCILTSSIPCPVNNPITSNTLLMTVNNNLPAGVSIAASSNPFCPGSSVTLTATPNNGGPLPVYQWKVNGINVGINSNTYTYNPLNGDSVRCTMTSNLACVTGNPASSNKIIMNGNLAPIVTFTSCFDTITTTNAKPIKLKGGIPPGGTYSGAGVSAGYYYPNIAGPGTHIITYSYTNVSLCTASNSSRIHQFASSPVICGSPITDIRDNKVYQTVQIGAQCWLASNLNFGTTIASIQDQRDNCISEKYCYNDNPLNCVNHGGLYQWDEVMRFDETPANQGFCPPGWHIPTENDWSVLFATFINNGFAGSTLKYSGYSGFNALLSGARHINRGWDFQGFATFFWSSTARSDNKVWAHGMNDADPSVSFYPASRVNAFSVRCLKD